MDKSGNTIFREEIEKKRIQKMVWRWQWYILVTLSHLLIWVSAGEFCHNKSLVALERFQFDKTRIVCNPKSFLSLGCAINLWKPLRVVCEKDLTYEIDDYQSIDLVLDAWSCSSYPDWISDPEIKCPSGLSSCRDSIERCNVVYDPVDTLVYILLILVTLCLFVIIVGIILYATDCCFKMESGRMTMVEQGLFNGFFPRIKRTKAQV